MTRRGGSLARVRVRARVAWCGMRTLHAGHDMCARFLSVLQAAGKHPMAMLEGRQYGGTRARRCVWPGGGRRSAALAINACNIDWVWACGSWCPTSTFHRQFCELQHQADEDCDDAVSVGRAARDDGLDGAQHLGIAERRQGRARAQAGHRRPNGGPLQRGDGSGGWKLRRSSTHGAPWIPGRRRACGGSIEGAPAARRWRSAA